MTELHDPFFYERQLAGQGHCLIAGVDEAGRGPLAGPVVAAAVILPDDCDYIRFKDSKKLTPARREKLYQVLYDMGIPIGVGSAGPEEIDDINILQASLLAMRRAVESLSGIPDYILVDGKFPVPVSIPQKALIKGEQKSASIAAASIIAKVTRDRLMCELDEQFPQYNFCKHKGYPTKEHKQLIMQHGPCPIHRKSFRGVREDL
ncbi:MAG: ribonuclease HII [Desulfobulbaceae bacterium]|uniref:Ribonuclease HII n=1 Tax=Candidatus Desulfobia pelagia TaxID=2841692 RepID=A0A8J6NBV5_9BACT|nr:ribonuclease HII [Candidatus Desulfobia pelagia]